MKLSNIVNFWTISDRFMCDSNNSISWNSLYSKSWSMRRNQLVFVFEFVRNKKLPKFYLLSANSFSFILFREKCNFIWIFRIEYLRDLSGNNKLNLTIDTQIDRQKNINDRQTNCFGEEQTRNEIEMLMRKNFRQLWRFPISKSPLESKYKWTNTLRIT